MDDKLNSGDAEEQEEEKGFYQGEPDNAVIESKSAKPTYIVSLVVLAALVCLGLNFFVFYTGSSSVVLEPPVNSPVERLGTLDEMGEAVETFQAIIGGSHGDSSDGQP